MAHRALPLAEEDLFAAELAFCSRLGVKSAEYRQLRRRRKIEHILGLCHVRNHAARKFLEALFHGANRITVEVSRPLLELGEVLDRAQAALRAMNLLIENSAQ